jgi:hypothetical protein
MGSRNYSIAITTNKINTLDEVKEKLHQTLRNAFNKYYETNWVTNRIYLEVTNKNIIVHNEDLCMSCLTPEKTKFEQAIFDTFNPPEIFSFFINDSDGTRGFALTENNSKRLWYELETMQGMKIENTGRVIAEESFVQELKENKDTLERDGYITFNHPDFKYPMSGQLGIIENVVRIVLLSRYGFDYEWQEFKNDVSRIDSDDFPISDLHLAFGE